ncbi:MAG: hypothetical protein KGH93_03330 [Patescibacteria group bacterium]|nr:hypothetical protein [Patescibacteria group bacterium]
MANVAWSALTLCTVADVRNRISSPEVPLYLNKSDDTRIAIGSISANAIITAVPNGLISTDIVEFETTGTLPTGLSANTVYYVVASTLTQTSFQVSSVKGGSALTISGGTGVNTFYNATVDNVISEKIALAKDWIRQDLTRELKQHIPELIESWLSYKRFQIDRSMQNIRRDIGQISDAAGLPTVGIIGFDGTIFDLFFFLTQFPQIHPRTYSNYGAPTNGTTGTMAGNCVVGDILIDTQGWVLYINKGTGASPTWKAEFTAVDALDNLLNAGIDKPLLTPPVPNDLLHVAVNATMWAMAQDGMFRNRPNFDAAVDAQFADNTEKLWRSLYKSSMNDIIPLLEIDIDGDGVLSDYERGIVSNEIAAIG